MTDETELTPKQNEVILALLGSVTVRGAARKAKVAVRTIYDWMREPAFKREYRRAQTFLLQQSLAELVELSKDAVAALRRNFRCKVPAVEVRAALGVLDKAINGQAMAEMQAEIEELRAMLERGPDGADTRGVEGGTGPAQAEPQTAGEQGGAGPGGGRAGGGPGSGVPPGGAGARPVAGGVPGGPGGPADSIMLSKIRENDGGGGEDADPLFG